MFNCEWQHKEKNLARNNTAENLQYCETYLASIKMKNHK